MLRDHSPQNLVQAAVNPERLHKYLSGLRASNSILCDLCVLQCKHNYDAPDTDHKRLNMH